MPRNVRNFWITLDVDGSKTQIATGPRSKDGGFTLRVQQRDKGGIIRALDVWGHVTETGVITLNVSTPASTGADIRVITAR